MDRHPASLPAEDLLAECEIRRQKRGGPGGQHRNKVETAVVITHRPTGVVAEANERRSQAENLAQATSRLRLKLAVAVRSTLTDNSIATSLPSPLWRSRCENQRISVSDTHQDFPALLAEALDTLAAADFNIASAASQLCVTSSQLTRFIQSEPTAWSLLNEARRTRGLRPLK